MTTKEEAITVKEMIKRLEYTMGMIHNSSEWESTRTDEYNPASPTWWEYINGAELIESSTS